MEALQIREKLHRYIDKGDDKLLKLMYALAKEYTKEDNYEYTFSAKESALFEERRNKRLNGQSKVYSWADAKTIITNTQKPQ